MEKGAGGKVNHFSEQTGKFYQLLPTRSVPALRINAVPMHRFAKVDPAEHTRRIIAAANPTGKVLDICTGLGYTAISAAKKNAVKEVVTVEKDPEVLALARANSASAQLFTNQKIKIIEGDAVEKITEFADAQFDTIIHDPPTFVMAEDLYTRNFCAQLYRVLKKGGTLWFYAAEPGKAGNSEKAKGLGERILKYLQHTGFKEIKRDENSTGIICRKCSEDIEEFKRLVRGHEKLLRAIGEL
ncbi:MAG TPA: methyltransferase [archaeon]|nr:methyltransferase [archaeon]